MPSIDFDYFNKNKSISERDFNKTNKTIVSILNSSNFRIDTIRKNFNFVPVDFEGYKEIQDSLYDDSGWELDTIPLIYEDTFDVSFFPYFREEYLSPINKYIKEGIVGVGEDEKTCKKILPVSEYHSLMLASYQLETLFKELFNPMSFEVETFTFETEFLVPFKKGDNIDITLRLLIHFFV